MSHNSHKRAGKPVDQLEKNRKTTTPLVLVLIMLHE